MIYIKNFSEHDLYTLNWHVYKSILCMFSLRGPVTIAMYEGTNANIIIMNTHANGNVVVSQDTTSDSDTGKILNTVVDKWCLL